MAHTFHFARVARKSRGFTLIELLLVITVGSAVILGAFMAFSQVQQSQRVAALTENVNLMQANARNSFRGQGTFAGISPTVLRNMQAVPLEMHSGAAAIQDPWGAILAVAPATINAATPNDAFVLTIPAVPAERCAAILTGLEGSFVRVGHGATAPGAPLKNATAFTFGAMAANTRFDAVAASAVCAGASTDLHFVAQF